MIRCFSTVSLISASLSFCYGYEPKPILWSLNVVLYHPLFILYLTIRGSNC